MNRRIIALPVIVCLSCFVAFAQVTQDKSDTAKPDEKMVWRRLDLKKLDAAVLGAMLSPQANPPAASLTPSKTPLKIEFAKLKRPDGVESVLAFVPLNALIIRATEDGQKRMSKLVEELEMLVKPERQEGTQQ